MEHDVEQRTVNFQTAVIVNQTELSESIHKEVHSRSGCADHFRQGFLAYFRNYVLRSSFFAKVGQQQKRPRQPLLSRVEELINQVCLSVVVAANEICNKQARKSLRLKRLFEDSVLRLGNRGPGVPGSFWRCAFASTFP